MVAEHMALQKEEMSQFSVYHDKTRDDYYGAGWATSSSGKRYDLFLSIPTNFPDGRPELYITDPLPLRAADGSLVSALGVSHAMHTLTPSASGWVQVCHWRADRWHPGILLYRVFLKGLLWVEAYEQHLATGRPLSEFVATMAERG
jgi:hypothetical protein